MRSLSNSLPRIKHVKPGGSPAPHHPSSTKAPILRHRPAPERVAHEIRIQKQTYYFDASWHTRKSVLALMNSDENPANGGEPKTKETSVSEHIDKLLLSIRPGISDDSESKEFFLQLLKSHLSAFQAEELNELNQSLATARYDCFITEPVIDDEVYREFGFANGPPHVGQRTLMTTSEFHETLDQAATNARNEQKYLPRLELNSSQTQQLRDQLAASASRWRASDRSLACLDSIAAELAAVLGVPVELPIEASAQLGTFASSVVLRRDGLVIDREVAKALCHPHSDDLFARVLRDLLECLLLHKLTQGAGQPDAISARQRQQVWRLIENIEGLPPTVALPEATRQELQTWMNTSGTHGQVQILPTVGVYLGHASIDPHLSVIPDKSKAKVIAGKKYMQGGYQLQPGEAVISEWPIHWLSGKENDEVYPLSEAWYLTVPVDATQLDSAARDIVSDWKASGVRYRFAELSPDKPASGCRISVWAAVQRGMTPVVRECFDQFNLGLPLPDSPTELWERLRAFKRWLEALAGR